MVEEDGVRVEYIFYSNQGESNSGIVLKVVNDTEQPVEYRFTVVIRSLEAVWEKEVTGRVEAGTLITGDEEGLYFQPFGPQGIIAELGLKAWSFRRGSDS